jgi:hypothetical protein
MKVLSINNLLYIFTFVLTTFLSGQNTDLSVQRNTELSHFVSYKTFGGRAFNLYKDLVTENLSPVSSGLIYSVYDKDYLSSLSDSISSWEGAVCYFPKEIWSNTAAKLQFAKDDKNWIPLTCFLGGDFLETPYLYKAVEMSELNELLGVWFLGNQKDSTRDGHWWNGGQFEDVTKKFIAYYVKFK